MMSLDDFNIDESEVFRRNSIQTPLREGWTNATHRQWSQLTDTPVASHGAYYTSCTCHIETVA